MNTTAKSPAWVNPIIEQQGQLLIQLGGCWTLAARIESSLDIAAMTNSGVRSIGFDANQVENWDSRLPAYLLSVVKQARQHNLQVDLEGLPAGVKNLLLLALSVPERSQNTISIQRHKLLNSIGQSVLNTAHNVKQQLSFIGELQLALLDMLQGKGKFRQADLLHFIQACGAEALPIVSLMSLLVGLILAFVGAIQLSMFGAQLFIADLVGLGTTREMGALMTAVIMSGRTGAAYAAQLGTMQVNDEIDAIKTMGLSPMQFLVLPRMIAVVVMMPLLCLYAIFVAIIGGALVTTSAFDISLIQYYNQTVNAVSLDDFLMGLFKSIVFAVLIASAGCLRGIQCGRSASAVGDATTAAVVDSIVYIVVADAVITLLCNALGI